MRLSVLGCGWLGFPLAQHFISEGFSVKGSTTSPDKLKLMQQAGIEAFLLNLPADLAENTGRVSEFFDTDVLFLNIPPSRGNRDKLVEYPALIEKIARYASEKNVSWVIFASSTSVYSDMGGITSEDEAKKGMASRPSGEAVLEAEERLKNSGIDYTILRFGGLYGYGRHPVNYLSGKKDLEGASKPVNLVHQLDCIRAVDEVIRQKKRNEIYNVVSDGHPPRKEFYQSAAQHFGLQLPHFRENEESADYRIVSNSKLKQDLGFEFTYPNPMDHTP
jgi:nucleoside-diphosphate-sugar epimerase